MLASSDRNQMPRLSFIATLFVNEHFLCKSYAVAALALLGSVSGACAAQIQLHSALLPPSACNDAGGLMSGSDCKKAAFNGRGRTRRKLLFPTVSGDTDATFQW